MKPVPFKKSGRSQVDSNRYRLLSAPRIRGRKINSAVAYGCLETHVRALPSPIFVHLINAEQRRLTYRERARHTAVLVALSGWHVDDEPFGPKGYCQPGVEAHDTQAAWIVLRQHQRCCSLQSV